MEETVDRLEQAITEIDAQMSIVTDFKQLDQLSKQREELQQELEKKMERWMELSERKEQIDALIKR